MFKHTRLFSFAAKALLSLIVFSFVWSLIDPYYNQLLVGVANKLSLPYLSLVADGRDLYFQSSVAAPIMGIHGTAFHFGFILLLALFIATPGLRFLQRLKFVGIGLVVMFAVQLVILTMFAKLAQSNVASATPSILSLPVVLLSTIGFNLLPVLIWAGLCLRQGLIREFKNRATGSETRQSVNAT